MSTALVWTPLMVYVAVSVLSAWLWGSLAWHSERIKTVLAQEGYEAARTKVERGKAYLLLAWPTVLPVGLAWLALERVLAASDPHRKHQADFERAMLAYDELSELEGQAGLELTAQMPQRWCACLRSEDERDPDEAEIQRRVEIELSREAARNGTRTRMHTNLMDIQRRLVKLGMWE